jgi:hypothetical protein
MLWNNNFEIDFFKVVMDIGLAFPEDVFYMRNDKYLAYLDTKDAETLTDRNFLSRLYTEKWSYDIVKPIANKMGLYAISPIDCPEIGLNYCSEEILAFCTTNSHKQPPENIKLLFQVKMGIVSNYQYLNNEVIPIGDYTTHKGTTSLLSSKSMINQENDDIARAIKFLGLTKNAHYTVHDIFKDAESWAKVKQWNWI